MTEGQERKLRSAVERLHTADARAETARAAFRRVVVQLVDRDRVSQGQIARLLGVSEKRVYDHLLRGREETTQP